MAQALRIGLTGGIGSGKSTVATMLAALGATVIDSDAISRATTAAGGSAIAAVRAAFGPQYIDAAGALNRQAMRDLVFTNPQARAQLEAIVHPLIGLETRRQLLAATGSCTVLDIPLLAESPTWRTQLDLVWVIDCTPATQMERVMARSGLTEQAVQNVIAAQASRSQRNACADAMVFNDGIALPELKRQVHGLAQRFGLSSLPPSETTA